MLVKRHPNNSYYRKSYQVCKITTRKFLEDIVNGKKTYKEFEIWLDELERSEY